MRNLVKRFCAAVLSITTMIGVLPGAISSAAIQYESDIEGVDFVVEVETGRDIKVLQLTDTQIIDAMQERSPDRLNSVLDDLWKPYKKEMHYKRFCRQVINKCNPDLILLTGDLVYGELDDNGESLIDLIGFMDSFEIPWAPVFGNHDNESRMGVDWQCEQLENSEYCLFEQRELTGNGNYTVGVVQGGVLKRVFFMMDSNGCVGIQNGNNHSSTEVGFGDDQIEWYTETINTIKEDIPDVKLSFAFHIQILAFKDAFAKYGFTNSGTIDNPINIDTFPDKGTDFGYLGRDLKSAWDNDYAVWDSFKELGVDSVFVGHEHCNSASVVYEGIRVQYGQKSSTYDSANYKNRLGSIAGSYEQLWNEAIIGGTAIELAETNGAISDAYIVYHEYEDSVADPDGRENVARGKSVDYLQTEGNSENWASGTKRNPAYVTDGDVATSGSVSNLWVYDTVIDLGAEYLLDTVNVKLRTLHVIGMGYTTYKLAVALSTDGVNYTKVATLENPEIGTTTSGGGFEQTIYKFTTAFELTPAKYIKIIDTVPNHNGNGYSMHEIAAYGNDEDGIFMGSSSLKVMNEDTYENASELIAGSYKAEQSFFYNSSEPKNLSMVMGIFDTRTNRLLSKKIETHSISRGNGAISAVLDIGEDIVGSGLGENLALQKSVRMFNPSNFEDCESHSGRDAANAVDGNETTSALSTGIWNWGLDVDLGDECDVSTAVLLFADNGYPINYTLSYSTDGENWKEIDTFENSSGGEKIHTFETVRAKYFRICDNVAQVSIRQMSLCEIELYSNVLEKNYELRCFVVDNETKEALVDKAIVLK